MFRNYLVTALRSLLRSPLHSTINIAGFAIGLTSCMLILLFVKDELSYDAWLADAETIFRIDTAEIYAGRAPLNIARAPGPIREALLADFEQIEDVTRAYTALTSVTTADRSFNENILVTDPNFIEFMGLLMSDGDARLALADTSSVALSERMAEKFFGAAPAIGQTLTILAPEAEDFVVSAVFETLPANSHMVFDIVITIDGYFAPEDETSTPSIPDQWGGAYFHTYLRLTEGAESAALEAALPAFIDRHMPAWLADAISTAPHDFYKFSLVPVRNIHFHGARLAAMKPGGDIATVTAFAVIALLILAIGAVNFANLMTARSALRAREIALRKTVGARRSQLIVQFLSEAVVSAMAALILALGLVELALPYYGAVLNRIVVLDIGGDLVVLLGLIGLATLVGVASGLRPAFVLSAVRPVAGLRSGGANPAGCGRVRGALVVIQFAISIALTITTLVVFQQTRFVSKADLGFTRDRILIVQGPEGAAQDILVRTFVNRLRTGVGVINVAASSAVPAISSDKSEANLSISLPGVAKPIQLGFHTVGLTFFQTYGVEPIAGRIFSENRLADATKSPGNITRELLGSAIINQSAVGRLGFANADDSIGQIMRSGSKAFTIIGVVPDLHFRSLRRSVRDEVYFASEAPGNVISIRFRTEDLPRLLSFIDSAWSELFPGRAIHRTFLAGALDALYAADRLRALLLGVFSVLAIFVSSLGLFSMASFSAQCRTREIGIRKVMGARTLDILGLLVWQFCKPVLIANVIAWPVAWWFLRNWLNEFSYRIELTPLPFVTAGSAALLIAAVTVGHRAYRAARARPISTLRYE